MKVIKNCVDKTENSYYNNEKPIQVECECCSSVFETTESEIKKLGEVGEYGIYYVDCPCCNEMTATEVSEILNENNIKFPKHFVDFNGGVHLNNDEIESYIKKGIAYFKNPSNINSDFWYCGSGDTMVFMLRQEEDSDNEVEVYVCRGYYETYLNLY